MRQLVLLLRQKYGLYFTVSQVWHLRSGTVDCREKWSERDPGRQRKYGANGKRAGRKKSTWYQYTIGEKRAAARQRDLVITVDPNSDLRDDRGRTPKQPKPDCTTGP
jgi:hypothetical protein